jgi:hypothetical protein
MRWEADGGQQPMASMMRLLAHLLVSTDLQSLSENA